MKNNVINKYIKSYIDFNQLEETVYKKKIKLIECRKTMGIKLVKLVVAVDFSNIFFSILNKSKYIESIIFLIEYFHKNNINPIFVFDGKPPEIKKYTIQKRKKEKDKAQKKIDQFKEELEAINNVEETLSDEDEIAEIKKHKTEIKNNIIKFSKRTIKLTKKHTKIAQDLFKFMNIPFIHIDKEADYVCANLVKNGIADACLSNDYDLLAFQCPVILRNLNIYTHSVEIIFLEDVCNMMRINKEQLTYLNIMNGCDYSTPIYDIKLSYIHTLFIKGYDIKDILDIIGNKTYNYLDAYNLFTEKIVLDNENINCYNSAKTLLLSDIEDYILPLKKSFNTIEINDITKILTKYIEKQNKITVPEYNITELFDYI